MKFAILTEILSTHSGSRAPIELAKHLSLGNKITLLAYSFNAEKTVKEELQKRGIKLILIEVPKIPFGKWWAAFKFLPHLKESRIISFHGTLPTFLVAKLSGLPLIKTYYGTQLDAFLEKNLPNTEPNILDRILNVATNSLVLMVERLQFYLANQVVAMTQYGAQEAQILYNKKVPYIYLGADSSELLRSQSKQAHPTPLVLSVSRITPYKGFHLLIEIVRHIEKGLNRPIRLVIVGSSPSPSYLNHLKSIATPNTKILTDIPDQELAKLYEDCDVYATCDRYLFFGLPPLEAALHGKASVALDYCSAREIIEHQVTGFVARNDQEFEAFLERLIQNPELRQKMGQEAKKRALTEFNWEKTAREYGQLFSRILKR